MILCCQTAAHATQHVSATLCIARLASTFSLKDDPPRLGTVSVV